MMIVPEMVRTALEIADVIRRSDTGFVPSTILNKHVVAPYYSIRTVLYEMSKAGLLKGRQGRYGGYKFARPFTLHDLMLLLAPTIWTDSKEIYETCDERANTAIRNTIERFKNCSVTGRKPILPDSVKEPNPCCASICNPPINAEMNC